MARALRAAAAALAPASTPASGSGDQVARFQRSIARWESPTDVTGPGHHSQLLLAHLFARTPAGAVALGPGSDFDTLLTALQHFGVPPHRIEQLGTLITHTIGASSRGNDPNRRSDGGYSEATASNAAIVRTDAVHAAIPQLRRALDWLDQPDDGPTRSIDELGVEVGRLIDHRLQARYGELAALLPLVIAELGRLTQSSGVDAGQAATLLTLALRAADGVAFKFGYLDLSARIIDRMRSSALSADDAALMAAVAYVRTETFFATGDLARASRLLIAAADEVSANLGDPLTAASYGSLHMRAAVVAGRAGAADSARDHLKEACHAAESVPEGVYLGTAFGPDSVRIHELAVAVELGDSPITVLRAATWHPPPHLPAERRSHYYIDLARAQLDLGYHEGANHSLLMARQVAPQHTREHPQVRHILSSLMRARRFSSDSLDSLAAWARVR